MDGVYIGLIKVTTVGSGLGIVIPSTCIKHWKKLFGKIPEKVEVFISEDGILKIVPKKEDDGIPEVILPPKKEDGVTF